MDKISAAELPVGSEVEIEIGGTWQRYVRRASVLETHGESGAGVQWWDGKYRLSGDEMEWYAERDRVRVLRTGPEGG